MSTRTPPTPEPSWRTTLPSRRPEAGAGCAATLPVIARKHSTTQTTSGRSRVIDVRTFANAFDSNLNAEVPEQTSPLDLDSGSESSVRALGLHSATLGRCLARLESPVRHSRW